MNAIEKFELGKCIKIERRNDRCGIFLTDIYFVCRRNVLRGLEEHLASEESDHDFLHGTYVYKIINNEQCLYIRFEPGRATIGSAIIY